MWRELWEDFKAWRRGEKRIAPRGAKGRIYESKGQKAPPGPMKATVRLQGKITKMRVYRAQEDAWYVVDPVTGAEVKE